MTRLLSALALSCLFSAPTVFAQIVVGPSGSGLLTFDSAPTTNEWTTRSYGGDSGGVGIQTAEQLDTQVQVVSAADVTMQLNSTATFPPGQNNYARWNSAARLIQSRIGNVEFTVTMARLTNRLSAAVGAIGIRYDMGGGVFLFPESVPAFRGFYSFTGQPGSWVLIPGLCVETTGTVSTVVSFASFGGWQPNTALYLLWADDNGPNNDPYYTIDNLQISVAPELRIQNEPSGLMLSWPDVWTGYDVIAANSFPAAGWPVAYPSSAAVASNGFYHILVPNTPGQRYFRLSGSGQ